MPNHGARSCPEPSRFTRLVAPDTTNCLTRIMMPPTTNGRRNAQANKHMPGSHCQQRVLSTRGANTHSTGAAQSILRAANAVNCNVVRVAISSLTHKQWNCRSRPGELVRLPRRMLWFRGFPHPSICHHPCSPLPSAFVHKPANQTSSTTAQTAAVNATMATWLSPIQMCLATPTNHHCLPKLMCAVDAGMHAQSIGLTLGKLH